jgi:hypothetical protein
MARWGERAESDGINADHFTEVFQVRRKWIYPDIGYVDFGHNNYREFFVGGGDTFYKAPISLPSESCSTNKAWDLPVTMHAGWSPGRNCSIDHAQAGRRNRVFCLCSAEFDG